MTNQRHILILGDSVFDNLEYIGKHEKDGQARMLDALPNYHQTFLAVDGHITKDVIDVQTKYIKDAVLHNGPITDLVMSIGGNNLLKEASLLGVKTKDAMGGLSLFRTRQEQFSKDYSKMLLSIKPHIEFETRWHILGIYYPCYSAPQDFPTRRFPTDMHFQNASRLGVDLFNSVIKQQIDDKDYIDLNHLFHYGDNKRYYANPIEPSSEGSRVIAEVIKPRIEGGK